MSSHQQRKSRILDEAQWATPQDIAEKYSHPVVKVIAKANRTAWPCHRQGQMIRFSPEDQEIIAEKWEQYQGEDPPVRKESYLELLMQEAIAAEKARAARGESPSGRFAALLREPHT